MNAKHSRRVVLAMDERLGASRYEIRDCQGRVVKSDRITLAKGIAEFEVPVSGLIAMTKIP